MSWTMSLGPNPRLDPWVVKDLYAKQTSVQEIARQMGVAYTSVWRLLRKLGLRTGRDEDHCRNGHNLNEVGRVQKDKGGGRMWTTCALCLKNKRKEESRRRREKRVDGTTCKKGHPLDIYWSRTGCRMCRSATSLKLHGEGRHGGVKPKPKPPALSWDDYAEAVDTDFCKPHWEKRAPAIKAWLIAHKVKPT